MPFQAGTAFVQVLPKLKGFHLEIKRELATIKDMTIKVTPIVDDKVAKGQLAALGGKNQTIKIPIEADDKGVDKAVVGVNAKLASIKDKRVKIDIDKRPLDDVTNSIALLTRNIAQLALPVGAALITPTLIQMAGSLGVATQSLLLLPALGAAGGAAMATLSIGTAHFGEAMKDLAKGKLDKFNEELAQMAPNAQATAREVQKLGPAWGSVRMDVQNRLFNEFSGVLGLLAKTYLPVVRTGIGEIATELNFTALSMASFAMEAQTVADVKTIFDNTSLSVAALRPGVYAILQILRDIAAVGSDFLPSLAGGFSDCAIAAADFISKARATGDLHRWISDGLDAVGQLLIILINAGSILHSIYTSVNSDGLGFLKTIKELSTVAADWAKSAEGQRVLGEIFGNLHTLAVALLPVLGAIVLAVIQMVNMLAPALPGLVTGMLDVWKASGSLLGVFGELAVAVLPALGAALSFLAPILGPLLALWVAYNVATKIYAVTLGIVTAAQVAYGVVMGIVKVATLGFAAANAVATASTAAAAAGTITLTGAQAAMNAVMMLNPIGIVVVALVALAAALVYAYNHSETFRAIVTGAWNGIKAAVGAAWAFIKPIWDAICAFLSATLGPAFAFLKDLVGRAWAEISTSISSAWATIKPVWDVIVNVIKAVLGAAFDYLSIVVKTAWALITQAVQIAWTILSGIWSVMAGMLTGLLSIAFGVLRSVVEIVWAAIKTAVIIAWTIISGIWNAMIAFIHGDFTGGFNYLRTMVQGVWNAIQALLASVWNTIRDRIWQPLVNFATQTIPQAFQKIADSARAVWDGVVGFFRTGVNGIIDAVNWMVGQVNKVLSFLHIGTLPIVAKLEMGGTVPAMASGGPLSIGGGFQTTGPVAIVGEGNPSYPEYVIPTDPTYRKRARGLYNTLGSQIEGDAPNPQIMAAGGALGVRYLAAGGVLDWLGSAWKGVTGVASSIAGKVADVAGFLTGGVGPAVDAVLGAMRDMIPTGMFGDVVGGIASQIGSGLKSMIQAAWDSFMAAQAAAAGGVANIAGGGAQNALNWARTQVGKPYVWGATGPGGYDCSGFMSAVTNVMRGRNPYSRVGSTASFPWAGFAPGLGGQFAIGAFRGKPGHMAGTLAPGVNVESSGSVGVRVGGGARGANNGMFNIRGHIGDTGGILRDGEAALNLSGGLERVLSDRQNKSFEQLVATLDRGGYRAATRPRGSHDGMRPAGSDGSSAPVVGTLIAQVPEGANASQVVDAALFKLRHARQGLHY